MKPDLSFEEAMMQLENIVKVLEEGNVGLGESIKLYEEGITLSDMCTKLLNEANQKIEVIKNNNYNESEFDNFQEDNNEL